MAFVPLENVYGEEFRGGIITRAGNPSVQVSGRARQTHRLARRHVHVTKLWRKGTAMRRRDILAGAGSLAAGASVSFPAPALAHRPLSDKPLETSISIGLKFERSKAALLAR